MKENITCMLIDDDLDDHEVFRIAIRDTHLPISCKFTRSCEQANEYFNDRTTNAPDFIFINWYLTGINGKGYLAELMRIPKLTSSQFVIYSSVALDTIRNLAGLYNCKFLPKTGSISLLREGLKSIFKTNLELN